MLNWLKKILNIFNKKEEHTQIKVNPPQHSIDNIEERSAKIKEVYKKQNKETEKQVVACPHCHVNTTEIVTCHKCGLTGCSECFTYDPSEGVYYCENCW